MYTGYVLVVKDLTALLEKSFENKTVLVVESEAMKYKYYERLLSAIGISAFQAESLQQIPDFVAQTNSIDLMIVNESVFGQMDHAAIGQIKSMHSNLPVISIIQEQDTDDQRITSSCPHHLILESPVCREKLITAISVSLGR